MNIFRKSKAALLLLILQLGYSVNQVKADDWLCTESASERRGSVIISCGIGEGNSEAIARHNALLRATEEFRGICDASDDCRNRKINLSPLRNACELKGDSQVKCYRAIQFEITDRLKDSALKSEPIFQSKASKHNKSLPSVAIEDGDMPEIPEDHPLQSQMYPLKTDRLIILSTIPKCLSIEVSGLEERTVPCDVNPKSVLIKRTDTLMRINAPAGFASKQLSLQSQDDEDTETESLQVLFGRR